MTAADRKRLSVELGEAAQHNIEVELGLQGTPDKPHKTPNSKGAKKRNVTSSYDGRSEQNSPGSERYQQKSNGGCSIS